MTLLRGDAMSRLLEDYQRAPRTFLKATEYEDHVSSASFIRDPRGREYKPEDYLEAFARYVRENASQVEAIRILLSRPKRWSTSALAELKKTLMSAPEHFTQETLERAHREQYHKALVDIISMVKHAAREQEPLLTATERVDRALSRVTSGRSFTPDQQAWLARIREALIENLSIDPEDFENLPVLQHSGGWGKANRVFNGKLDELLKACNEGIAA
jgi:type I restriction enzyme R subunit